MGRYPTKASAGWHRSTPVSAVAAARPPNQAHWPLIFGEKNAMATYMIRGTISVRVKTATAAEMKFDVAPVDGFVAPERTRAIAFKIKKSGVIKNSAKLIRFKSEREKSVRLSAASVDPQLVAPLCALAVQQKPVELHFKGADRHIVKFVFPCK